MSTISIDLLKLETKAPALCERVLLINEKGQCGTGQLSACTFIHEGRPLGRQFQVDTSMMMDHDSPIVAWAPFPANDDSRWIETHDLHGVEEGTFNLVGGQCVDNRDVAWVTFDTCSFKRNPFPGLLGSHENPNHGTRRYMSAERAFEQGFAFPQELVAGESRFEIADRWRAEFVAEYITQFSLAIINEGSYYRRYFFSLVDGGHIKHVNLRCELRHWADSSSDPRGKDRAHGLKCWAAGIVALYERDFPELIPEIEGNDFEARRQARLATAAEVLDYYADQAGLTGVRAAA